jgi:hypothetical protein
MSTAPAPKQKILVPLQSYALANQALFFLNKMGIMLSFTKGVLEIKENKR